MAVVTPRESDPGSLHFLDAMDRVNRVAREAADVDELLRGLLDEMLELFGCDRAWLLYPCDPEAPSWRVPMERSRPEWPGAFTLGVEIPMDAGAAAIFAEALAGDEPLPFDRASARSVPEDVARAFRIRAQMLMAVHPKTDRPWLLGIHHCAEDHVFTEEERRVFAGICTRVGDWLGTLLVLRDLRASERRYRTLVEHAPEAIVVMDSAGRLLDANANAAELFGHPLGALLGASFLELSTDTQPDGRSSAVAAQALRDEALGGGSPRFEWTHRRADGATVACEVRLVRWGAGEDTRIRASVTDVSERLALQAQVLHLEKMKAIGELAGGVAHDFNNQLVAVLCHADLLRLLPGVPAAVVERAGRIIEAGQKAAELTGQLLAFSRRALLQPRVLDLNLAVTRTTGMLRRIIGSDLKLDVTLRETPTHVKVDPAQLEQVLVNLITNARDALTDSGHIHVGTAVVLLEADDPRRQGALPVGRYVALTVADDGAGMDAATLARVFEPFFTTKASGEGTGLGLSTAYGVIAQSGGTIAVDSAPGQGATFTVLLPEATEELVPRPAAPSPTRGRTGGERVLVVEDNPAVSEVTVTALRDHGYEVLAAADGVTALELCTAGPPFDLLLTDVVMPELDGVALAERARAVSPSIRILFASGHSASAIERLVESAHDARILRKPYTAVQLLDQVREALDA